MPTSAIMVRLGNRLAAKAAIGAAMTPPIKRPSAALPKLGPSAARKATDAATVTTNSARLTVPTAIAGEAPRAIKLETTIGPHPPRQRSRRQSRASRLSEFLLGAWAGAMPC
jgi:hypothetical protein